MTSTRSSCRIILDACFSGLRSAVCYPLAALYAWHFAALRMDRLMWAPASFAEMVDGAALTPFQYRVLIPWTVDLLRRVPALANVPLDTFRFGSEFLFTFLLLITFRAYVGNILGDRWNRKERYDRREKAQKAQKDTKHGGSLLLRFLRLFAAIRPVSHDSSRLMATLAVLLLAWALPFHYLLPSVEQLGLYYVYDLPSVFFFTLGLLLLYRRRWLLFYPVFLLATFNRETTCFLTLIYLFTALPPILLRKKRVACTSRCKSTWRWPAFLRTRTRTRTPESPSAFAGDPPHADHRPLITDDCSLITAHFLPLSAHCLAQLALWLAVKGSLSALYGGSLHYVHYSRNFYLLRVPETYPLLLSVFGFAWIPVLLGLRRIANSFVRRALYVVPVFFAGMFIVAQIYELRLYGEMIPVVLGALACVLTSRYLSLPLGVDAN